jgi:two-component system, OmpR family, phosphate regulon sensor histidine kinase PhoR
MKKKLMIFVLATLLFSLVVTTFLFIIIANYQYFENIKHDLAVKNRMIINLVSSENIKDVRVLFREAYKGEPLRLTYIDKYGNVLQDSMADSETMENHNTRKEVIDARARGTGNSLRFSDTVKKNMIYVASEFGDGDIVRSSIPMEFVSVFHGRYLRYYLITMLLVVIMAVILSSRISHVIIKPIKDLEYVTSRVAKGELDRRFSCYTNDEIGQLGRTFNDMAHKLQSTLRDLIEKQNRLEAILKSMDSGVIAVDRSYRIIMINPYAKEIFGISKDIIGQNLMDNIRDFEFERVFKNNDDEYKEVRILWPKERVLRIKTADIINESEHIGTVAVVHDVTDIKRLENMRSEFVANVSHELKTPLTSIKGFAETLRYVADNANKERFLDIINDEAERLTRLINDILILSDIELHKEEKSEEIDVNEMIKDVYYLIKNTADKKDIKLNIVGEQVPAIYGDGDRFKQMLLNLVDNAVKYSESGDSVYIGAIKEGTNCVIWVEDTGVGIPKDHIPRLFERFYRVDKARSRAQGGTGLGLAIVKHIVIGFNGTIDVESFIGKGSKFIVKIPLVRC